MHIPINLFRIFVAVGLPLAALLTACGGGASPSVATSTVTDTVTDTPMESIPPGHFQIASISPKNGAVELTWSPSNGAAHYGISYGRISGVFADSGKQDASSPSTVSDLNNGFPYYFMVTASSLGGQVNANSQSMAIPMYTPTLTYSCSRNLYVAKNGDDSNLGTSLDQPYKTINAATTRGDLKAGDCINVLPGVYTESVSLRNGGNSASATGYVVLRSSTPQAAKLVSPENSADPTVGLGSNYLVVEGFDVRGALGSGLDACISKGKHHIAILNNVVHDAGESGISMCWGDYFHIEGNVSYNNASTNLYQGSGISIYEAQKFDDGPGFHITVRNNIAYGNHVTFDCASNGKTSACHTDGNGIIIDDFHNSQTAGNAINYAPATLVENNLVFNNGGAGIQVYLSDNVTVRNNTAYFNSTDTNNNATWRAEMSNSFGANNLWVHNIAVPNPAISLLNVAYQNVSIAPYVNPGVVWNNNMADGAGAGGLIRVDTAGAFTVLESNPLFMAPSIDPMVADFRLQSTSPARAAGEAITSPNPDNLNGRLRSTSAPDLGAY